MEEAMKKSLILAAMMLAAATLFAEFKAFYCETDLGVCTYEQNENYYCESCSCAEGVGYAARNCGNFDAPLPTVEECFAQINNVCKNTEFRCENNAGKCFIAEFKAFILKGNVMDMAIGVIIGTSFANIVKALTDDFINPIINYNIIRNIYIIKSSI